MRKRISFVSNSSSSSFLLGFNDLSDFDKLREFCYKYDDGKEYFDTFFEDVKNSDRKTPKNVRKFLIGIFERKIWWHSFKHEYGESYYLFEKHPRDELAEIGIQMDANMEKLDPIMDEGIKLAESKKKGEMLDYEALHKISMKYAQEVYKSASKRWKNLVEIGYSDEDGEFWGDMEHMFMSNIMVKQRDNYALVVYNQH